MYIVICIQLDRKEMNPILLEAIYQDHTNSKSEMQRNQGAKILERQHKNANSAFGGMNKK